MRGNSSILAWIKLLTSLRILIQKLETTSTHTTMLEMAHLLTSAKNSKKLTGKNPARLLLLLLLMYSLLLEASSSSHHSLFAWFSPKEILMNALLVSGVTDTPKIKQNSRSPQMKQLQKTPLTTPVPLLSPLTLLSQPLLNDI